MEWRADHAALSRPNLVALAIKSRAFPSPHPIDPAGVSAVVTGEPMLLALYYWVLTLTLNSHLTYRSIFSRGWVVAKPATMVTPVM